MKPRSLYEIAGQDVGPISDLLKALVEVNWHVARAEREGWAIDLVIMDEVSRVTAIISRNDFACWPAPPEPEQPDE